MAAPSDTTPRLPHAAPFLMLDRVVDVGERSGVFSKHVTGADPCVAADGTLPAAFLLEALAQGGGALVAAMDEASPKIGYLASVDDFRAHSPARVGDTLRIEVEIVRHFAGATLFRGRALVGDRLVAEGRFTLAQPR